MSLNLGINLFRVTRITVQNSIYSEGTPREFTRQRFTFHFDSGEQHDIDVYPVDSIYLIPETISQPPREP